jgi:Tol biopolymer transport system component
MRPDGSGERRLLPGAPLTETDPSWTPDGQIVFARAGKTARSRGIFIVRANGTGLRRHGPNGGDPDVSPDGRRIVFAWMHDDANQELFVMNRNGTGTRQLTATNGVTEWNPEWQRLR